MKRRTIFAIMAGMLAALFSLWWAIVKGPLRNPEAALRDFYNAEDRAEDQRMDPLILTGRGVVPLVLKEIPNKEMRLRRYAIGFLGNGRYAEALPTLEAILQDESETHCFRADALQAIYQISKNRAEELAPLYVTSDDLLGQVAGDIVSGRSLVYFERSYWEAFWHSHD